MIGKHHSVCSDTEYEGAVAVGPKITAMHEKIKGLYCIAHPHGLTDFELTNTYNEQVGKAFRHSLGARRFELVEVGFLVDTGVRRKNPVTGVNNIVWGLAPKAA